MSPAPRMDWREAFDAPTHSQIEQERWVLAMCLGRHGGRFAEIGAFDGVLQLFDHLGCGVLKLASRIGQFDARTIHRRGAGPAAALIEPAKLPVDEARVTLFGMARPRS